jgi:hypothetical protein
VGSGRWTEPGRVGPVIFIIGIRHLTFVILSSFGFRYSSFFIVRHCEAASGFLGIFSSLHFGTPFASRRISGVGTWKRGENPWGKRKVVRDVRDWNVEMF